MALNFSLLIGGVEYINNARVQTIKPIDSLKDRSDSMVGLQITLRFTGDTPELAIPKSGQEIVLIRDPSGANVREFGGVIQKVREIPLSPQRYLYEISASDYVRWFDRYLVQGVFYPTSGGTDTAGNIVKSIVTNWANKGTITWDVTLVDAGPTIPAQYFDFLPPTQAIDQVAKLVGYRWDVNYLKQVVFTSADNNEAPLATIDCENDVTSDKAGDLILEDDASQVVNTVYIKDAMARATNPSTGANLTATDNFKGDGSQTFFPLGYQPSALADVTVTKGATVYSVANGNLKEENVDGQPGDGNTADVVYLCMNNWGIRFGQAPANGVTGSTSYGYLDIGPQVYQAQDSASVADIASRESSSGVYEEAVSASQFVNASASAVRAYGDLQLLQRHRKTYGAFRVFNQTGWKAGQYLQLKSTRRLGGINQRMYVIEVQKSILSQNIMAHTIKIASDLYSVL